MKFEKVVSVVKMEELRRESGYFGRISSNRVRNVGMKKNLQSGQFFCSCAALFFLFKTKKLSFKFSLKFFVV